MAEVDKEAVLAQLRRVRGPDLSGDIVTQGLVSDIFITGGKVMFSITVPADRATALEPLRKAAETAVREVSGVDSVMVVLTADKRPGASGSPPRPAPPPRASVAPGGGRHSEEAPAPKAGVPGVNAIIAVASGKGGVGKSTTAVNLALAMKANGLSVGILDADIYGPSMPRLMGLSGRPESAGGRVLKPMRGYGVNVMSIGFLVAEDTPMIWRGPMVISALTQMLREVVWGTLDVLVVDMPPGTGDAQLTMAQQVPLAGAVIVSTPQDLALIDARKSLAMFRRVDVPVLGIVENMSYFLCPHCGERTELFGHGGARREAERLEVPFLGEVPLDIAIRETSDSGKPIVASDPDGPLAAIYRDIARKVWEGVEKARSGGRPPPRVVVEEE